MDEKSYSVKFPEISEFNVRFYVIFLCEVILLAGLFVWFGSRVSGQLFFFATAAIFLVMGSRIQLIRKYLIAKLQASLSENMIISKKFWADENLLLRESALASEYYKWEKRIRYTVLLLIFFIFIGSRAIHLSAIARFNFLWILTVGGSIVLVMAAVHNIMNYLKRLIQANYDRTCGDQRLADLLTLDHLSIERYLLKWKRIAIIFLVIAVLCPFVLLMLEKGKEAMYFLSALLSIVLILITLDLNKVVKSTIPALARYDALTKRQVGVTFKASGSDRGASEFSGELNKSLKDFFK